MERDAAWDTYSSFYAILAIFDEDGDFPCAWGFQNLGQGANRLLEDMWRTNIDLGDDYHHRHIQRKCDSKMLSVAS